MKRPAFISLVIIITLMGTFAIMAAAQDVQGNNPWNAVWSAIEGLQAQIDDLLNQTGGRLYVGKVLIGRYPKDIGGYAAADAICDAAFEGSCVCTVPEIFESLRQNLIPAHAAGTVNSGIAADTVPPVADCRGWNGGGTRIYFTSSDTDFFFVRKDDCSTISLWNIACCK